MDKPITNFKEIFSLYEKLIGINNSEEIREKRIDLIKEINKSTNNIRTIIKRHIKDGSIDENKEYSL